MNPSKKRLRAEANLPNIPADTPATPRARGYNECPCPKKCVLHGECRLCTAYHARKNKLPRCQRNEPERKPGFFRSLFRK